MVRYGPQIEDESKGVHRCQLSVALGGKEGKLARDGRFLDGCVELGTASWNWCLASHRPCGLELRSSRLLHRWKWAEPSSTGRSRGVEPLERWDKFLIVLHPRRLCSPS